mmetsp:Transcript_103270/g.332703  ORF Transcript_103270/g.332703 Transcript_103270/m.332703 type:complete len:321 (-) Transcript_103270:306-1268(-)
MTSGPPWVCEFCVGSGNVNEESTRPCANCKGEGSLRAGRGNTYVCTVCNGEGDHTITKEVKCTDCKGTGHAMRSQAQQPRPKAKSRSQGAVAPPAGADEEDEDLEGGDGAESEGSQDRKDTAAASSGRVSTLASAAAAKLAGKKAPADKAQKREEHEHRGVRWAPNEGLVIEVTVSPRALMNSIGTVLLLLGWICDAHFLGWLPSEGQRREVGRDVPATDAPEHSGGGDGLVRGVPRRRRRRRSRSTWSVAPASLRPHWQQRPSEVLFAVLCSRSRRGSGAIEFDVKVAPGVHTHCHRHIYSAHRTSTPVPDGIMRHDCA